MDMRTEMLPIGSVVHLEGGNKRMMIFGILQADSGNPDKIYDYVGVPYPEGNMGAEHQYLFMHQDVVQVHARGFEDVERSQFLARLEEHEKQKNLMS